MQCGVEERTIRRQETVMVECFKYREKRHKYRKYPLWRKAKEERRLRRVGEERVAHVAMPQKTQQRERPVRPIGEKVQKGERKLRRVEEGEVAHVAKP